MSDESETAEENVTKLTVLKTWSNNPSTSSTNNNDDNNRGASSASRRNKNVTCDYCNKFGHSIVNCRKLSTTQRQRCRSRGRNCLLDGERGHQQGAVRKDDNNSTVRTTEESLDIGIGTMSLNAVLEIRNRPPAPPRSANDFTVPPPTRNPSRQPRAFPPPPTLRHSFFTNTVNNNSSAASVETKRKLPLDDDKAPPPPTTLHQSKGPLLYNNCLQPPYSNVAVPFYRPTFSYPVPVVTHSSTTSRPQTIASTPERRAIRQGASKRASLPCNLSESLVHCTIPSTSPSTITTTSTQSSITRRPQTVTSTPTAPPPMTSTGSSLTDTWICETCTFINNASVSICEICCKTRNVPPLGTSKSDLGVLCLFCAESNPRETLFCIWCGKIL